MIQIATAPSIKVVALENELLKSARKHGTSSVLFFSIIFNILVNLDRKPENSS
jgi:hypothetical protein